MNVEKAEKIHDESFCQVCNSCVFKYKCPQCLYKYCSVGCFQTHKKTSCKPTEKQDNLNSVMEAKSDDSPHEDKLTLDQLLKFQNDEKILAMLKNHKILREILSEIDSSKTPETSIQQALNFNVFRDFFDTCLSSVST
eukprot:Sdes_comp9751_c0_seq1m1263